VTAVHAIEVQDTHRCHGIQAVDELSFRSERGRVFALVDPDGAAETTMTETLNCHHCVGIDAFLAEPAGARRRSRSAAKAR
jgi:ABC-type uncharacterized transport system ATPase subunit